MSTTSAAILKALSEIVKRDPINYVSLISYGNVDYYLVLGRFSFYFIKRDLSKCDASIKYAFLDKCLVDLKKVTLLLIKLNENREITHPTELFIFCQDRNSLIEAFTCYW